MVLYIVDGMLMFVFVQKYLPKILCIFTNCMCMFCILFLENLLVLKMSPSNYSKDILFYISRKICYIAFYGGMLMFEFVLFICMQHLQEMLKNWK